MQGAHPRDRKLSLDIRSTRNTKRRRIALEVGARSVIEHLESRWMLAGNAIVTENQLPGTPQSTWDVSGAGDQTIQGFSTDISVNVGQTVQFKINDTASAPYHIDIYRMGYYQGNGARLEASIASSQTLRQVQPAPITNAAVGLTDCGNWAVSASWQVPSTAVSGIYFARVTRDDTGGASHIIFIVRNDASHSDLLFQTSDSTWQAYNTFGGNSLYEENNDLNLRAYKVSYNRPLEDRGVGGGLGDYNTPFHAEYPMVRWLEKNGYDVSYFTDVDSDRNGALIKNHKVFMSVGHDEYWSGAQRANVEAARDAGVNLAFFSGNESFWKTRWENSTDSSGTPYRTLVTYKESKAGAVIDPLDPTVWTGTWRDDRFSPPADGGRPENAMSGTIYMNDRTSNDLGIAMNVPASDANLRFWRNTAVSKLTTGQTATLGTAVVGYEVDEDLDNGWRPAGLMDMSSTSFSTTSHVISAWGTDVGPGSSTHSITLYRAASGALVFGAGTVQWSWGLDGTHDDGGSTPDTSMQQATVNLLADMSAQPATLQSGLLPASPSTDTIAPTSVITSPTPNTVVSGTTTVTVTGTASDAGGGVVAGVEVSVDGGTTWHPAVGKNSWSYTFTPKVLGPLSIKTRASDDSGNVEIPSAGVTVSSAGPMSFWGGSLTPYNSADTDGSSTEVGVKFKSDIAGYITGLQFYKGTGNTGTHVGSLWSSTGTLLASATFTNETATGWQRVTFAQPVPINAGTTYVASYHAPSGHYAEDDYYFLKGYNNTTLHALAAGVNGPDGVYASGTGSIFPTQTYLSANYYVDVLFNTVANDTVAPTVLAKAPAANANNVVPTASVSVTFSEPIKAGTASIVLRDSSNAVVAGTATYDATSNTLTFTPGTPLAAGATYTATASGGQDLSGNLMSPVSWSFTTSAPLGSGPFSIWTSASAPQTPTDTDPSSTEVGVKFRSDVAGQVTAIRFYKGSTNTGTHVADLWSATGQLLATGTFTNETATGWQQVNFATPVTIAPNTTYIASYHTNVGHYAEDDNFFANTGVDTGPLHALQAGIDGFNGVYGYGPAGTFPSQDYLSANYWVDVVLSTADTTPPSVTAKSPAANATGVRTDTTVTATFSESVQTGFTFILKDSGGNTVPANVAYVDATHTATLTPTALLNPSTTYTVTVSGAKDGAGNVMPAPVTWSFTTLIPDTTPPQVTAQNPVAGATNVSTGTTVAVTFSEPVVQATIGFVLRDSSNNVVPATLSYNAATLTATLTPSALLTPATTYTATVSGVQDLSGNVLSPAVTWSFTTSVPDTTPPSITTRTPLPGAVNVSTGTTITATFSEAIQPSTLQFSLVDASNQPVPAQVTYNAATFVATLTPLAALGNGAVYTATVSGAKDLVGNAMSAPVSWNFSTVPDTTPPTVTLQNPAPNATGVSSNTTVSVKFSEPIQPGSLLFTLADPANNPVPASVTYDAATLTATLTPTAPLVGSTKYTAAVAGTKDLAGNVMSSIQWTFTTAVPLGGGPFTIWGPTAAPTLADDPDTGSVEIGVKFQSDVSGYVTGIRFYKGSTNTGTHTGNLWSSTGTLLATGTFTGESASGWQQLNFATPIAITAGTTYVASYHAPVGQYAADNSFFAAAGVDNGPLHALSDAIGGGNGVYAYGATSLFPSSTYLATNYWVDVVFARNYFLQTTAADFNGGAASGARVTSDAGGEVQLAPSFQDDFTGATLGSSWTKSTLGTGASTASLASGVLSLGSAQILGGVTTSPVEARLTIAAAANQYFGLATNLSAAAGNYWAAFTTSTTTNSLYGQVNLNGTLTTTKISALLSGYHVYRVQPISTGVQFWVDGVLKLTVAKVIPATTSLRIALGATAATPLMQADWARAAAYTSGGTFVSSVLDAGHPAAWGAAQFTATLPPGTSLLIETSSGNTATPDGTWSAWSALGSGNIVASPPARYLRYRITLITTDPTQTPTLSDILFTWS